MRQGRGISGESVLSFLVQFGVSLVAVVALAGLAGWANIARRPPPLDEAAARGRFEDFPHLPVEEVWVASDGSAALGHAGPRALLVWRWADDYLLTSLPLEMVHAAAMARDGDHVLLQTGQTGGRWLKLPVGARAWPPARWSAYT